jgi:hypothetical protein
VKEWRGNGREEDWKIGRMEGWRGNGRMDGSRDGRGEDWKDGSVEA